MLSLVNYLSSWSRHGKVALQVAVDVALVALSFCVAMAIRLENWWFLPSKSPWLALSAVALITVAAFWMLGLYKSLVRYVTGRILLTVAKGALLSAAALYVVTTLLGVFVPRSVPIIYCILLFLSVGGIRFIARSLFRETTVNTRPPAIIYGAGDAGLQVLNALYHGRNHTPVAMVDDDPKLQKLVISGLAVHPPTDIARIASRTGAKTLLLAMPSLTRKRRLEIIRSLEGLKLEIKTVPSISEIITGTAKLSEFRSVQPEDLLGRDPVEPDQELLRKNIEGKVVMVSGAGGSIGSELCRQILPLAPRTLVLFEISEFALYTIDAELTELAQRLNSSSRIVPILGSVQDDRRLAETMRSFGVQTIYHAAAYKHVPLVEENVVEGIRNNVFGTLAITSAARRCGVESFILISTDKAVRPTNVMGASKRIAELICQAHAKEHSTTLFSMVRFGNVLGSSGSVIPRFKAQIEKGGPVTVTHREINRYFMTIPEASQLVIQAGAMARGGDVFILDMGPPVRILDLAMDMIRLHGLVPYEASAPDQVRPELGDMPVCVTGLRKGEKLYEELLIGNDPKPTQHPRVMTASETSVTLSDLLPVLEQLKSACEVHDVQHTIDLMMDLPLAYNPPHDAIFDVIWTKSGNSASRHQLPQSPAPH